MAERDDAETAAELADALRDIRDELRADRRRGPAGLPAPPSPSELLRFADDHAIPAAIAILEANIRVLEFLQGAIRLAVAEETATEEVRSSRAAAITASRQTLSQLENALADIEAATNRGTLPDGPGREILAETRKLRAELESALAETQGSTDQAAGPANPDTTDTPENRDAPVNASSSADRGNGTDQESDQPGEDDGDGSDSESATDAVSIDVESELATIKEELDSAASDGEQRERPADEATDDSGTDQSDSDEPTARSDSPPSDSDETTE